MRYVSLLMAWSVTGANLTAQDAIRYRDLIFSAAQIESTDYVYATSVHPVTGTLDTLRATIYSAPTIPHRTVGL